MSGDIVQIPQEALMNLPEEYIDGCMSLVQTDEGIFGAHEHMSPIMYLPESQQWAFLNRSPNKQINLH